MKTKRHRRKIIFLFTGVVIVMGGFFLLGTKSIVQAQQKKVNHEQAYKLYTKNCLGCHDSIADPEKSGKTRDEWYIVVNVMHKYGLDLTVEEREQIIDLLYDLRKGMEKEAG